MTRQPVTAETITDEQIRELREHSSEYGEGIIEPDGNYLGAAVALNLCDEALGELDYGDMDVTDEWVATRVAQARARCAAIINARTCGEKEPK